MKRKFVIIERSTLYNRAICVDLKEGDDILKLLRENDKYRKKLTHIFKRILEHPNMYYEGYKRINLGRSSSVTEMRLFPNGDNCRIYCKEILVGGTEFCIIMAVLLEKKKSQKINKLIQQIIDRIKTYEYEL
jgi:hypothetical protein